MTDVPPRQDSAENDDRRSSSEDAKGAQEAVPQDAVPQETAQWSAEQPAPAPWFLGQPGPVPPGFPPPQGWPQGQMPQAPPPMAPPLPPPTVDQANWPNQAPGTRPEQHDGRPQGQNQNHGQNQNGQGQNGQNHGQGQGEPSDRVPVPPWTGQLPPNPEQPQQQQPPAPWLDPSRYTQQPGQRPPVRDPRTGLRPPQQQQQPRREEPEGRPPLSLRTRWARGLALGGALCVLLTLLNGYRNFPAWLIGASVALVMSLGGLWLGAFAQRDATRQAQRAPEAVASVVWSGISTLIAVAIVAFSLIFYPQLHDYSNCMRSANTIAGQKSCQQQFDNSMTFKP